MSCAWIFVQALIFVFSYAWIFKVTKRIPKTVCVASEITVYSLCNRFNYEFCLHMLAATKVGVI